MLSIKRLIQLKNQSNLLINKLEDNDPIKNVVNDYVSKTGLTKSDITEKIDKIKSCCSIIELKADYEKNNDGTFDQKLTVSNANFCKQHAICSICADRSQSRRRARFNEPIKEQASKVKNGHHYAYIVTYTVKDGDSLSERLAHLKESRLKWRKMGQKRKKTHSNGEAKKIVAGLSTIEIKRGNDSEKWHVHAHELLFTNEKLDYQVYDPEIKKELHKKYGNTIPKEILNETAALDTVCFNGENVAVSKISREWYQATGEESLSISVEPLQHVPKHVSYKKKRKLQAMTFEQSIAYQAREVIKYISKASDNSPSDLVEIIADTYNKRMVATYGEFRGVPGNDYEIDSTGTKELYTVLWDSQTNNYGNPIPGSYKELKEEETETRSRVAKILGQYRRQRKIILESGIDSLSTELDNLKLSFRENITKIWEFYRNKVKREKDLNECDKYNPLLSLNDYFVEASSDDLYSVAFS